MASKLKALALTEWDPERQRRECHRAWNRVFFNMRWGREIGTPMWGLMDVWPGPHVHQAWPPAQSRCCR